MRVSARVDESVHVPTHLGDPMLDIGALTDEAPQHPAAGEVVVHAVIFLPSQRSFLRQLPSDLVLLLPVVLVCGAHA